MGNKLKISIVTVSFNAVKDIEETILSVVDQTYDNLEYIVIDGASTDGTADIIKKYAEGGSEYGKHKHTITYWVSEPDKGIYDAMNKGILVSSGDYINFMNAGDTFYDNETIGNIEDNIELDSIIIYGQLLKKYKRFQFISNPAPVDLEMMKESARLPHQAMFAKSTYLKSHKFSLQYKSASDFKFYYEAHFIDNCKFKYIPVIVAVYDSETGLSKDSYIGPMESLKIQGKRLNKYVILKLKLKFCLINLMKRYLPEGIISKIRIDKFSKLGYNIITN